MKNSQFLPFLPAFFFFLISCNATDPDTGQLPNPGELASFSFEEEQYDFGEIQEGDTVYHTFQFVNSGDIPLVIQDVSSSCGCTIPSWTKESIPVGEKGAIDVMFTKSGDLGLHNRTIVVSANTDPAYSVLSIRANVLSANKNLLSKN